MKFLNKNKSNRDYFIVSKQIEIRPPNTILDYLLLNQITWLWKKNSPLLEIASVLKISNNPHSYLKQQRTTFLLQLCIQNKSAASITCAKNQNQNTTTQYYVLIVKRRLAENAGMLFM